MDKNATFVLVPKNRISPVNLKGTGQRVQKNNQNGYGERPSVIQAQHRSIKSANMIYLMESPSWHRYSLKSSQFFVSPFNSIQIPNNLNEKPKQLLQSKSDSVKSKINHVHAASKPMGNVSFQWKKRKNATTANGKNVWYLLLAIFFLIVTVLNLTLFNPVKDSSKLRNVPD